MIAAEAFKALGDPVRLEMVRRLSGGAPYTVGSVSLGLGLTRQGARKHLDVLARAKLVVLQPNGRETKVSLDRASLATARSFIADLEKQWDSRLQALREFVETETRESST